MKQRFFVILLFCTSLFGNEEYLRFEDIKHLSVSEVSPDTDAWIKTLEPLHLKQTKRLGSVRKTVLDNKSIRVEKGDVLFKFLASWCKTGVSFTGLNDLETTTLLLDRCLTLLKRDIEVLSQKSVKCIECNNKGTKKCVKCVKGRLSYWKGTKQKKKKCPECKGRGELPCKYQFHARKTRIKALGGFSKAIKLKAEVEKQLPFLQKVEYKTRKDNVTYDPKLIEQCRKERYYYIMLELLKKNKEN